MSKYISFLILFILSISFLPISLLQEAPSENGDENYIPEDFNETYNQTYNESAEVEFEDDYGDPLQNYNFTNVLLYDDSNYTQLEKSEAVYVLFYSPYCYHCHQFLPTYVETADYCKEKNINIAFSRIDANANANASEAYKIEGYPTVFLILNGKRFRYDGPRTKESLLNFANRKKNGDIFKITKLEEIKKYQDESPVVLLSTVKDKSSKISQSFNDYAEKNYDYSFLSCLSDECNKKYGEDVILFKNYDEKEMSYVKYYGKLSDAKDNSVYDFTSIYGVETGAFLTPTTIEALVKFSKDGLIYVRNSSDVENVKYDKLFKDLGKELRKDNIYTFVSDTGESEGTNVGVAFSILPSELPCIFYYQQLSGEQAGNVMIFSKRYLDMKKESKSSIQNFIKDVKDGKLRRDLFSEDVSQSKVIDGMRYLVGKTFDKYVTDEKRNVFLAVVGSLEDNDYNFLFIEILKNLTKKYEDLSFTYINIEKNEPRDIILDENEVPAGFLYTNAMDKKEVIKFVPQNYSEMNEEEIEAFLDENLKKEKTGKNTDGEKQKKKEDKKEGAQTDL